MFSVSFHYNILEIGKIDYFDKYLVLKNFPLSRSLYFIAYLINDYRYAKTIVDLLKQFTQEAANYTN